MLIAIQYSRCCRDQSDRCDHLSSIDALRSVLLWLLVVVEPLVDSRLQFAVVQSDASGHQIAVEIDELGQGKQRDYVFVHEPPPRALHCGVAHGLLAFVDHVHESTDPLTLDGSESVRQGRDGPSLGVRRELRLQCRLQGVDEGGAGLDTAVAALTDQRVELVRRIAKDDHAAIVPAAEYKVR